MGFAPWEAARTCTDGPAPGAVAFMRWFTEHYVKRGGFNLGIFNCRTVRGGRTTSMHGEGRACDLGFPIGDPDGMQLLRLLIKHAGALGIQCIIYRRRIYSAKNPEGAHYSGVAPHWDHLHVEFSREAARRLTYATVKAILTPPVHEAGSRVLKVGAEGKDVLILQRKLKIEADGFFGPNTKRAVLVFERNAKKDFPNLLVDGIVGDRTWVALGVKPTF